jgi:hypothetical protein
MNGTGWLRRSKVKVCIVPRVRSTTVKLRLPGLVASPSWQLTHLASKIGWMARFQGTPRIFS